MRKFARSLIAAERRHGDATDTDAHAAFRVCGKLRQSLAPLAGVVGFRTLLARALTLARLEVPELGELKVGPTGALLLPERWFDETREAAAAKGGEALVGSILDLLALFIGDGLTRGLLQEIWPEIALGAPKTGE